MILKILFFSSTTQHITRNITHKKDAICYRAVDKFLETQHSSNDKRWLISTFQLKEIIGKYPITG